MKRFIILLTAGICFASCSTTRFQPHTEAYDKEVRVDTTFVLDSVYIDRVRTIREKADTVYVTDIKTEYKYRYRDRVKIDTLIQKEVVTETQLVEKELTSWQRFRIKGFWVLLGLVLAYVLWRIAKKLVLRN